EPEAEWLLNVTNDAWFGDSSGPYQHLAMARFRAVENGVPVVRSANTGISAVVDPYGRVSRRLPLGEAGAVDSPLPKSLGGTPYRLLGDAPTVAIAVLAVIGCFSRRSRVVNHPRN